MDRLEWERLPWRIGRTLGRSVYVQVGAEPSKDDYLLGLMETVDLAVRVVDLHNASLVARFTGPGVAAVTGTGRIGP